MSMQPPDEPPTPSHPQPPTQLHYGHYGPSGQGWPTSTDLPPGYQPMPTYPAAGQPGYPAAEPVYATEQFAVPQAYQSEQIVEAEYVPEPALPAYPPATNLGQPAQLRGYEDATPLFDQHPPPIEPEVDWAAMPAYPVQREPSEALTGQTPVQGTALHSPAEKTADAEAAVPQEPRLPQRVPAEPDVPAVPDIDRTAADVHHAAGPDLARIASYLRHDEDDGPRLGGRPDGFDIPAVIEAVRGVPGVREANLTAKPDGVHTLRLELADDADPGRVSRAVARLLNERMGLAAEPNPPNALAARNAPPRPLPPGRTLNAAPHSGSPVARRRRPVSARRPDEFETVDAPIGVDARPRRGVIAAPRVVIDQVEVTTQGVDAMVEVRLSADGAPAVGVASGPAVDGYILRLAAVAAASAIDELLVDVETGARSRCFIEHAALCPLGSCEVAVVVLLLMCDGWVEQLTGSAVVAGDPRQAVVRATLAAVNRRLEALLP
jgi:hypothetical protein